VEQNHNLEMRLIGFQTSLQSIKSQSNPFRKKEQKGTVGDFKSFVRKVDARIKDLYLNGSAHSHQDRVRTALMAESGVHPERF